MLRRGAKTGAKHSADDDGGLGFAAEHVAKFGRLIENLIEAHAHKIDEHELDYGAQAGGGRPDSRPYEGGLGYGGVEDAVAEFPPQALGDSENTAPGIHLSLAARAADDVFAHKDDALVPLHFLTQGFADRLLEGLCAHLFSSSVSSS